MGPKSRGARWGVQRAPNRELSISAARYGSVGTGYGSFLANTRARAGAVRVSAGGWIWPAFATCTWPFSAGQGCAKVPDYRFIDIKLINYVPYVPIVIARAGYEVYAQIIICQNSIALRAQSCEAALQCVDSAAERALGCQLGVCRAGSSSFSSSRHRLWPWSSAAAARGTEKAGEEGGRGESGELQHAI